jgi:hypothetical protein
MRTGIFLSAMLATALVGSTALAERNNDSDNKGTAHSRDIKERVLHESRSSSHVARERTTRTDALGKAKIQSKTNHNAHGDMYDNYGGSAAKAPMTTQSSSSQKASKAPAAISQKGGEEMVDKSGKSSAHAPALNQYAQGGIAAPISSTEHKTKTDTNKQVAWSAGGKSVRSYVHFVNDKGQINNQIRGNTATAMKARNVAKVILKTAGIFGKLFNWEGSGGDNSADLF